jgi:Putative peptidoglycan-binding domain-containing protein
MNSFRTFARRHISSHSLYFLLLVGLGTLTISGATFVHNLTLVFDDIDRDIAPALINHTNKVPPPSLEVPDRSLALGERSKEVLLLQNFLVWKGLWPKEEELTSYFGEATLEWVKKYQESVGIEPEGIVGPKTLEAWKKDLEKFRK